jgi:hypothetical protein
VTVTPAPVVELLLDGTVTEDEERDVIALFTPLGYTGRVRRQPSHRGVDDLAWLVLAALPLQAFLKGIGGEIGTDAVRRPEEAGQPAASR